jgi:hypothetical protein
MMPAPGACQPNLHETSALTPARSLLCTIALVLAVPQTSVHAQTDYYNTDRNRPLQLEDSYALRQNSLDLFLAPVSLRVSDRERSSWEANPGFVYGLLPRTQVGITAPIRMQEEGDGRSTGLAGVDLSALYNFNAETMSRPALGLRANVLVPAGRFGPDNLQTSVRGIGTRSFSWGRLHLNGQYTFGRRRSDAESGERRIKNLAGLSRWLGGIAVDHSFPLSAFLLTAETYAAEGIDHDRQTTWHATVGARKQLSPTLLLDAGLGRQFSGERRNWLITLGIARTMSVSGLFPGLGKWGG